ncbi:MAG TPA: YfhO family protein, partial [Actinomycetota bacterium]|nr:YfhO family protein [Actinomycetota bacterium]
WTALALAATAGYLHADGWPRRLGWLAGAELCLTQVAAAHLTDGLLIALLAVGLYAVARSISQVREGARSAGAAVGMIVVPFVILPLLAAGVLLPRLALLPRTSIGHGYQTLGRLADRLSGTTGASPIAPNGVGPWWGTAFARAPGGYAGVLSVLLLPMAFSNRRWRLPAVGFGLVGLIGWLLNLDGLVSSPGVRSFALRSQVGELWLRDPFRFRYLVPLAVGVLAGYAVEAWLQRRAFTPSKGVRSLVWVVPGLVFLVALPLLAGARPGSYLPLLISGAVMLPVLAAVARGRLSAWLLPALAATELVVVALASQPGPAPPSLQPVFAEVGPGLGRFFAPLHEPTIVPADYVSPGPIGRAIERDGQGRYVSFDPRVGRSNPRGFLLYQGPHDWAAYANGRSVLFGLDEIQGYSPVQLFPYWKLVRRVDAEKPIFYNTAYFQRLDPGVLDLFSVEWVIERRTARPPPDSTQVAVESRYVLYRIQHPTPRASVVFAWRRVGPDQGLDTILGSGFDQRRRALVAPAHDATPGPATRIGVGTGTASYEEIAPNHARVDVTADRPGMLVVRNPYDRNWTATVDGKPAPVFVADYVMQGVPIPEGHHVVELRYRDQAIGLGLAVSGVAWLLLLGAWAVAWRRARRPTPR